SACPRWNCASMSTGSSSRATAPIARTAGSRSSGCSTGSTRLFGSERREAADMTAQIAAIPSFGPPTVPSVKNRVSAEEWKTRTDLAALYRLVAKYGMTDLTGTHLSARVPGEADHFLINPYGLMFEEVTASNLVKVDESGEIVLDTGFPVNPAG